MKLESHARFGGRTVCLGAIAALGALAVGPMAALAKPTQEQVLRSISENVSQRGDPSHALAILCGLLALILLMVVFAQRNKHRAQPKALNHHGRLLKEVARGVGIKPGELKRLRQLTQQVSRRRETPIQSPLTLLICPSLAGKKAPAHASRANAGHA